jgi:hypothetical protein
MLLAQRFAFLTAGYSEDEGALNRGAVACPLCGGSPSCLPVGESSMQRWSPPSVLMWSPPLVSRSEPAILRPLLVWR